MLQELVKSVLFCRAGNGHRSVSISVQPLKETGKLKSREGTTILGAAVIDDILVIIVLAFVMSFAGEDVNLGVVVLNKVIFLL